MKAAHTLKYLADHGIKPSAQRIAVMDYLMEHRTHPTVDQIHQALVRKLPTLSKTTVYNTLKLLTEKHAAKLVTIDERNACFDADTAAHAHFMCTRCGCLLDVPLRTPTPEAEAEIPEGCRIEQTDLYLRGLCPDCARQEV